MKKLVISLNLFILVVVSAFTTTPSVHAQICVFVPNPDSTQCPYELQYNADETQCNDGRGCPATNEICCVPLPTDPCDNVNVLVNPPCALEFAADLTVIAITAFLIIGALWTLWVFFKSAFNYIIAGESKEKTQKARLAMFWSAIGLFGLGMVYAFFEFVLDIVPNLSDFINFG